MQNERFPPPPLIFLCSVRSAVLQSAISPSRIAKTENIHLERHRLARACIEIIFKPKLQFDQTKRL